MLSIVNSRRISFALFGAVRHKMADMFLYKSPRPGTKEAQGVAEAAGSPLSLHKPCKVYFRVLRKPQYSTVTALVFRYSDRASSPRSFPKPDCLKPPKGEATSVLL